MSVQLLKIFYHSFGITDVTDSRMHTQLCLREGGLGGRYKISAISRGLYTCNVKVLAWGGTSPPAPTPTYGRMIWKHTIQRYKIDQEEAMARSIMNRFLKHWNQSTDDT